MTESIKETADKIFGVNASPIEPLLSREISLEEMLLHRAESEQKLKEKRSKRKSSAGKESTLDTGKACPKCGIINWDKFPDGRKYCLSCGAVMEIDGTVTGGAIKKEIKNKGEDIMIDGELRCERCGKVKPFSATEKELIEFIKQPHKNCGGKISFILKEESKDKESKPVVEAVTQNKDSITVHNKCKNPKREKFVCYKCDWGNCSQTYSDAIVCLLINIDMKLKKLLERLPQ